MILGASAVVKRDEGNNDDFLSWSCCLTPFAELPLPDETPERFADVIGIVSTISDVVEFSYSGRMYGVARRDVYIMNPSGEERIKVALCGEAAYRFSGNTVRARTVSLCSKVQKPLFQNVQTEANKAGLWENTRDLSETDKVVGNTNLGLEISGCPTPILNKDMP